MADDIVLNFQDSLLRKSDVELLNEGQWLNDKMIGFMYEYFEYNQFKDLENVLFVHPDVAQCIKLCKGPELSVFFDPLQLHLKKIIFFPVNSNENPGLSDGTHWSLLVYDANIRKFKHYDSASVLNNEQAMTVSCVVEPFLKVKQKVDFIEENCPQQTNSYDCGMYVISVTEYLCQQQQQQNSLEGSLNDHVSPVSVKKKRKEIKCIIDSLKNT